MYHTSSGSAQLAARSMPSLPAKAQRLSDVELAVLLSLASDEHCIIHSETESLADLRDEARLVASITFGLSHVAIECGTSTTVDDINAGILTNVLQPPKLATSNVYDEPAQEDDQVIAQMIILTGLSRASSHVQLQMLELLRTRRVFTHTAVYAAPKTCLLVLLQGTTDPPLLNHINDLIFISHYHDPMDGYVKLESESRQMDGDGASATSVVNRSATSPMGPKDHDAAFPTQELSAFKKAVSQVVISAEMKSYLFNVTVFLRMHRAVGSGITPVSTRHLETLAKCLAPLHGLQFVTPQLVDMAARKVYSHRVQVVNAESERSLQYGSDLSAVEHYLNGYRAERVIDETLERVEVPL